MIKLVYCLRKRADVPQDEFYSYWHRKHAPLVKSFAEALRARRYVQSHTLDSELNQQLTEGRGMAPPYDGITEVWWESLDELRAGLDSESGAAAGRALMEDEARFIDLSQSRIFLTEEHEIFDREL